MATATFTATEQAQLDQLEATLAVLAEEQDSQLYKNLASKIKKLHEAKEQDEIERAAELADIFNAIVENNMTFAELMNGVWDNDNFTKEKIIEWCQANDVLPKATRGAAAKNVAPASTRKTRTAKEGLVLFSIQPTGAKGAPTQIMKGASFPISFGAKLAHVGHMAGDTLANLMTFQGTSDEAKEYLATEEGQVEAQKWANYIDEESAKV